MKKSPIKHSQSLPSTTEDLIESNQQHLQSLETYEKEKIEKKHRIQESIRNQNKTSRIVFGSDEDDDIEPSTVEKERPNDSRFELSEELLEKDEIEEPSDEDEISIESEKQKALAILDRISAGKQSASISKTKTKMIRFDPNKIEHRVYELDSKIETNGQHLTAIPKSIVRQSTTPTIDSTRTYDYDQSRLKSMFDNKSSADDGQFRFQFFDNSEPIQLPVQILSSIPRVTTNGQSKKPFGKVQESSNDEDDDEISTPSEMEVKSHGKHGTFFFFDIDDRLKEGLESFVRTEELTELQRAWPTKRKEIGEALRAKHRKAVQRKDRHRVLNYRRRQNQHQPSNRPSKSDVD